MSALPRHEQVAAPRPPVPTDADITELADVFGLLSDPNRLRLLIALRDAGELCVGDLAAAVGMAESSTSHALRLLRAHRVVSVRRAGRNSYYALADSHVRLLLELGLEHTGHVVAIHPERDR